MRSSFQRHGERKSWTHILAATMCFAFLASQAFAQGIVLGRREIFLDFGYLDDQEKSATQRVTDFTFRQRRFDERLLVRGDLSVLDPALLTINFSTSFGFLQDHAFSNGERLPSTGRLIGYDLVGNFLSEKSYSATLFANRSDTIDSREFIGMSETQSQNQGAIIFLKGFILPSSLSFRQESYQETSRFGGLEARRDDFRNILAYDGQNRYESHDVGVHAEFAHFQDHVQPAFSYGSRTANFYDRYHFGDRSPKLLSSRLNYIQRGGRLRFSTLTLDEELRIEHSPSLSTAYDYLFSRATSAGIATTAQTAVASLQHRLYESLRTGLSLRGTQVNFPAGGERILAARADTNYRKKLRGHGRLLAGVGGLYQFSDNRLVGREIAIFLEGHPAHIGLPFRLDQPGVIPGTILVSGETGAIFQEGLDYAVRLVGQFTEIDILSSARIREGDNLLIDYRIDVPGATTFSTRSFVSNIGLDYGWVNPYYSYERNVQNLLLGVAQGPLENLRAHATGIRFRWSGSRFSGTLQNEYRTQDSRLLPYTSLQFSQYLSFIPRHAFTFGLSFDEALFHYRIPARKTEAGTGRFSLGWAPAPSTTIEAFVADRIWKDTLAPNEDFRDAGIRIKWITGKVTFASSFNANWRRRNGALIQDFRWSADIMRRF
jgi:hypothetical protein